MRLIITLLISFFLIQSCEKNDDYSSILGEWLVEDKGEVSAYQRYNVSIQRLQTDTALYKISNFYRTGMSTELIIEVDGLEVFIQGQNVGNYYVEGYGTVSSDYKKITMEYQVNGPIYENVISDYTRE